MLEKLDEFVGMLLTYRLIHIKLEEARAVFVVAACDDLLVGFKSLEAAAACRHEPKTNLDAEALCLVGKMHNAVREALHVVIPRVLVEEQTVVVPGSRIYRSCNLPAVVYLHDVNADLVCRVDLLVDKGVANAVAAVAVAPGVRHSHELGAVVYVPEVAAAEGFAFALLAVADDHGVALVLENYRAILSLGNSQLAASPVGSFGDYDHRVVSLGVLEEEYIADDRLLEALIEVVVLSVLCERVNVVSKGVELYRADRPMLADELKEYVLAIVTDANERDVVPKIKRDLASVLARRAYSVIGNRAALWGDERLGCRYYSRKVL